MFQALGFRLILRRFNEAGMFPSQKCAAGGGVVVHASMRPGCFHPRNAVLPVGANQLFYSFNEAGMFPSQKCRNATTPRGQTRASMRPGCFHPRNITSSAMSAAPMSFNEAGMFPSQKSGRAAEARRPRGGFNEAGMFPSQKCF